MQCGTTSAYTSALCEWTEERAQCGQWMKQSTRGGKDRSITGTNNPNTQNRYTWKLLFTLYSGFRLSFSAVCGQVFVLRCREDKEGREIIQTQENLIKHQLSSHRYLK